MCWLPFSLNQLKNVQDSKQGEEEERKKKEKEKTQQTNKQTISMLIFFSLLHLLQTEFYC